jgi:hypothetical protein
MDIPGLSRAVSMLRAYFETERQAGFPRLTRTPASNVISWLDYFASLPAPDQQALLDSLSALSALRFFPLALTHARILQLIDSDPPLIACRKALQSPQFSMGLRYEGIRMRKAMMSDPTSMQVMAQTRASLGFTPRDDMPAALVPDPEPANLKPAKAPQLRKLLNEMLKPSFPEKRKLPGGETVYTGTVDGSATTVRIDFGGMGMQMKYLVSVAANSAGHSLILASAEDLWMGGGGWDYITEENAEASVHLLGDSVHELVLLRNKISANPAQE